MRHSVAMAGLAAVLLAVASTTAGAGAIDEVMKRQRNGLWEIKPPGYRGKPYLFCVTDAVKIGGLEETAQAVRSLGCKVVKDSLDGDRYEVEMNCSSPDAEVGRFRMVMKGTARADYQSGTTVVSGGGRMIQALFPSGQEGGGESRWIRPCKPGEMPGLQKAG